MNAAQCRRCGCFWAFAANPDLFHAITKWCPTCLPKLLPTMGNA